MFCPSVLAGWECRAGEGREPQKADQHLLSFIFPGEELCLQGPACGTQHAEHTSRGWALGCPGSALMDTDKGLPAAPRPWAALNSYLEMLHPRQTPLTPQKYPKEQLALGNLARCVCRGAQTAIPGVPTPLSGMSHPPPMPSLPAWGPINSKFCGIQTCPCPDPTELPWNLCWLQTRLALKQQLCMEISTLHGALGGYSSRNSAGNSGLRV